MARPLDKMHSITSYRLPVTKWWDHAFLQRRPSLGLGLFRFAVAFTVAAHVIPSLLQMEDNYLSTAFKTRNHSFFPVWILRLVAQNPDWTVWTFVALFLCSLGTFTLGLYTQVSCILMTLSCYYFYALNALHIGTLSFDILLVTLVLMAITNYHGDAFSLDALRRADSESYKKTRPFFIQRLLQLQIASTYFYTALCKFTAGGNWITGNPIYFLLNSTSESVVKHFPLRGFFAAHPELCHVIGIGLILSIKEVAGILPISTKIPSARISVLPTNGLVVS
jgi:hypothetical protein